MSFKYIQDIYRDMPKIAMPVLVKALAEEVSSIKHQYQHFVILLLLSN